MSNLNKKNVCKSQDDFYASDKEVSKSNAKLLLRVCASLAIVFFIDFLILMIGRSQFTFWKPLLIICGISAGVFGFLVYVFYSFKGNGYSNTRMILIATHLSLVVIYASAIAISSVGKYPAAFFLAVLIAIPLIVTIEPKMSYLYSGSATVIYLILSYFLKRPDSTNVFSTDLLNCLGIMFINVIIGNFYYASRKDEFMVRQQYKHLSGVDELTELANRRQFNINYEKNYYKCLNEKKSIGLFLMDIDDFKNYNDLYGHLGGDECLKKVGKFFRQYSEKNPAVSFYRYGGEEFIGVAYNIGRKSANEIANDLVTGIRELKIKHMASTVSDIITVSVGAVLQYPSAMSNSADFINLADKAMYKVKENGKNGFLFY